MMNEKELLEKTESDLKKEIRELGIRLNTNNKITITSLDPQIKTDIQLQDFKKFIFSKKSGGNASTLAAAIHAANSRVLEEKLMMK